MLNMVNLENYSAVEINAIIERAIKIKNAPFKYSKVLLGKKLYMLFQKTSTRTALSFAMGMSDLGGSYFTQNWQDSNFVVGEICDEVRYVGRNVDIIMARLKKNADINEMAEYTTIPVINGCCDKYHPCQALADMMTIKERFGGFNINLLYIGIHNNVVNSLMETLPHLGGSLYILTPIINEPSRDESIRCKAESTGRLHLLDPMQSMDSLMELINKMNVIYTDSWVDMEFFNDESYAKEKARRINLMQKFQINKELLRNTKAFVMHDMPIHCGYEITRDVVEENIDVILQQSENRRHAQNGVLVTLLNADV